MLTTTLAKIRARGPCESGWKKLLAHLGKTKPDDAPLPLSVVFKSNGILDTLWCLRACNDAEMFAHRFALDMAKRVYPIWHAKYPKDGGVKHCIAVIERFLRGKATKDELTKARAAAVASAASAASAAHAAAAAASAPSAFSAAFSAAAAAASAAERKWQAKHFLACLKAWPNKPWPKVTPIKVKKP